MTDTDTKFTKKSTDLKSKFYQLLALRITSCLLRLVLRGYSVASLPRSWRLHSRLLSRFAPSIPGLRASHSHSQSLRSLGLCARKNLKKKSVSQSTWNALKRIEMQKNLLLWPDTRFALRYFERHSATLPTPCHSQGPKECPCQVSCRLVQNCMGAIRL